MPEVALTEKLYLAGSGHFGFGFMLGFIVMLVLFKLKPTQLSIQLYAPFSPFALGTWATLPYIWTTNDATLHERLNIFVLYPLIHQSEIAITVLGRPNWAALICATLYIFILLRYIRLVKYCKKYGWLEGSQNAR